MDKEELLRELSIKINNGELSREEVLSSFTSSAEVKLPHFTMTKMLYVLGAAIVVIGIVILVAQIWEDIGSFGRIVITLGLGMLLAFLGSSLLKLRPHENIGHIFHFMGGMLIPGGVLVTLYELTIESDWSVAFTFGAVFLFYIFLNNIHRHAILTFFSIANGTTTVYLVLNAVVGGPFEGFFGIKEIYQYLTMAVGASYILLAYAFREGWNRALVGALYFFGISGFLGAAFSQVVDSVLWQLMYFFIVFAGLFLSVYTKSRSILLMSTLFLIAHVSYITDEYFADSLGWPISLVILGFVFIGLGYTSLSINRRYIKEGI